MTGLQKILKLHGEVKVKGQNGETVVWVWDYMNDKPRKKSEMTKQEIADSKRAKNEQIKPTIK